jgi:hypothetical protein
VGGWGNLSIMLLCRHLRVNYVILHELVHVMCQFGWAVLCPMIGQSTEQSRTRFSIGLQYVSRFVHVNVC